MFEAQRAQCEWVLSLLLSIIKLELHFLLCRCLYVWHFAFNPSSISLKTKRHFVILLTVSCLVHGEITGIICNYYQTLKLFCDIQWRCHGFGYKKYLRVLSQMITDDERWWQMSGVADDKMACKFHCADIESFQWTMNGGSDIFWQFWRISSSWLRWRMASWLNLKYPFPYPKIVSLRALKDCNAMSWPGGVALWLSCWLRYWLMLYILGLDIMNVHWCKNSNGLLTIFTFRIWIH